MCCMENINKHIQNIMDDKLRGKINSEVGYFYPDMHYVGSSINTKLYFLFHTRVLRVSSLVYSYTKERWKESI